MEDELLKHKLLKIIKEFWLPITIGIFGLIFLGYGLIYLTSPNDKNEDIIFESLNDTEIQENKKIIVDVEGAVINPGVYVLSEGARVKDALIAASGFSANADRDWIAKNLNLAQKITDETKIYIPSNVEITSIGGVSLLKSINNSGSGLININKATIEELDTLPGVGPKTSQKIIDNRPYSNIEELLSKKIVGSKVFSQIKDKITIN